MRSISPARSRRATASSAAWCGPISLWRSPASRTLASAKGPRGIAMEVGVFIPIGNNGWLISETSPQYMPTFELNKEIVQKAEGYGFDFALSMIKLRGFGGKTEFWEHNLE